MNKALEKTHYRKAFNSPYLSSADIVEPTILKIARVVLEADHSKKTKDHFNTAYFSQKELRKGEPLKPMILNASNSKMMKEITGSHFIDDWSDVAVQVYVDHNVKFGRETVEGLRIMPAPRRPELTPNNKAAWDRAIQVYAETKSLEKVLSKMDVSDENQQLIKEAAHA